MGKPNDPPLTVVSSTETKTVAMIKDFCPKYTVHEITPAAGISNIDGMKHDECEFASHRYAYPKFGSITEVGTSYTGQMFILDLGCPTVISKVLFKNSHMCQWNDRGTKEIKFELSDASNGVYVEMARFEVPSVHFMACKDIPLMKVPVNQFSLGQFVKVSILQYEDLGGAIQYIDFEKVTCFC